MGSITEGARQAVVNCVKVTKDEKVVVITDDQTMTIGLAIGIQVEKITKNVRIFLMEDFGIRPLDFPEQIGEALMEADASFYVAQGAPGELQTFRKPMLECIDANEKLRHGHMIGVTSRIMETGMCSDYQEVQRIGRLVHEKVKNASRIRVVSDKGTNFTATFSPDLHWKICDGDITSDDWSNLPDGENFTSPKDINGTVIIDGCLGDYFTEKFGSLEKTPVTVEIEVGRAVRESIHCDDKEIEAEFIKYLFETDENSSRVGEFAIGTNVGLTELIGNLL